MILFNWPPPPCVKDACRKQPPDSRTSPIPRQLLSERISIFGWAGKKGGWLDDGFASLKKALALTPGFGEKILFLGIAHSRQNKYVPAIAALRIEIKLTPADPKAWMWLGVTELAAERPEEAAVALDKAAKLAPNDVDILYHRGHAHLLVSKLSYEPILPPNPDPCRVRQR